MHDHGHHDDGSNTAGVERTPADASASQPHGKHAHARARRWRKQSPCGTEPCCWIGQMERPANLTASRGTGRTMTTTMARAAPANATLVRVQAPATTGTTTGTMAATMCRAALRAS